MASVTVNNVTYDLQSCSLDVVAADIGSLGVATMLEEMSYSTVVTREAMYGSSRTVQDFTEGESEHEFSVTVQKSQWDYWIARAREAGIGMANIKFAFTPAYFKDGILTYDIIHKALARGPDQSYSRGPDNLVISIEFDVSDIFYGGTGTSVPQNMFGQDYGTAA